MSLPWFRLYDEVVNDPKVQRLPPELFRSWINFMCIANKNTKNRGALPCIEDVSFRLNTTVDSANFQLKQLVDAELFEWKRGLCWSHNWKNRQFLSDSSTDRVKRFRKRSGNVSETLDETPQIQTRSDTDTEKKEDSSNLPKKKSGYGSFGNVFLTSGEWDELNDKFGVEGAIARIDNLSNYIASKGKKYKSHYATILVWERKHETQAATKNTKEYVLPFAQPIIDNSLEDQAEFNRFMGNA